MTEVEEKRKRRALPANVVLYILSLLCVGVPIMFFDVRVCLIVIGGLLWLDLFLSSVLEQIADILAPMAMKKWKGKRHDRTR